MKTYLLLLFLIFPLLAKAVDIRQMVKNENKAEIVKTIDPDKSLFGIPLGTTEDEFIKKYGKPTGYVQMSGTDSGMIYGKQYFFFFEGKKLTGLRISHNILDWKISNEMYAECEFDNLKWKLDNGIHEGMKRSEVKKILGDRLKTDGRGYQAYYETQKSRVDLDFSHMSGSNEKDDQAFTVFGITVKPK